MKQTLPRRVKRRLKEYTNPQQTKRYCMLCEKMRRFKYDRFVGHSACVFCGSRISKKEPPKKKGEFKCTNCKRRFVSRVGKAK